MWFRRIVSIFILIAALGWGQAHPLARPGQEALPREKPASFPFTGKLLFVAAVPNASNSNGAQGYKAQFRVVKVQNGKVVDQQFTCEVDSRTLDIWAKLIRVVYSRDGRSVLLIDGSEEQIGDLVLLDLNTGTVRKLMHGGRFFSYDWSLDGRYIVALGDEGRYTSEQPVSGPAKMIKGKRHLSVIEFATGKERRVAEHVSTATWSLDGKTVIYSRTMIDQRPASDDEFARIPPPAGLKRVFFGVSATGGEPKQLDEEEVDRLLGPAYRRALSVYRKARGAEFFAPIGLASIVVSPNGKRAMVNDVGPRPTFDIPMSEEDMAMVPRQSPVKQEYVIVDGNGKARRYSTWDSVLPYQWSRDGRWIYAVGANRGPVLLAVDAVKGSIRRLAITGVPGHLIACYEFKSSAPAKSR